MRQSFDPQLQKSISETLYRAIVANNTLRQEKQRLHKLHPTLTDEQFDEIRGEFYPTFTYAEPLV